jgi:hypothetical protein
VAAASVSTHPIDPRAPVRGASRFSSSARTPDEANSLASAMRCWRNSGAAGWPASPRPSAATDHHGRLLPAGSPAGRCATRLFQDHKFLINYLELVDHRGPERLPACLRPSGGFGRLCLLIVKRPEATDITSVRRRCGHNPPLGLINSRFHDQLDRLLTFWVSSRSGRR